MLLVKCKANGKAITVALLLWQDLERRNEEFEELTLLEGCFPEAEKLKQETRALSQVRLFPLLGSYFWDHEGTAVWYSFFFFKTGFVN